MKITFVNGNYKPAWGCGGPARLTYELATYFHRRNWQVRVVTSNFSGQSYPLPAGYTIEEGIGVHRLPCHSIPFLARAAGAWPANLGSVLHHELSNSDASVVMNTRSTFAMLSALLCRRLGVPYAMAALGSLPGGRSKLNRAIRVGLDPALVFPNCRKARFCVAQTENECEEYRKIGVCDDRVRLIPLGCDFERFRNLPPRGIFRKRFGIPDSAPMGLFVGRLHILKGVDTLIAAAARVKERFPDFRLAIVGKDYGDEARLKVYCRDMGMTDSVVFSGPLYENDVLHAYIDADVYNHAPRHYEETSLASIEAGFCGKPLIFTKEAEAPFFAAGGGGLCVQNNIEGVSSAIMGVLSDKARLAEMTAAARRVAIDNFSMEAIGRRYEEAFTHAG